MAKQSPQRLSIASHSLLLCLVLLVGTVTVAAAGLEDAVTTFSSGSWKVLRSVNVMTDEVSCTGVYGDSYGLQLTKDTLYVTIRGGIRGYRIRFDDEPVSEMKLATDIEKRVDAVGISGKDFQKALRSRRLRLEVLTLVQGIHTEDLNMEGIGEAHQNILAGCPVNGSGALTAKPDSEPSQCSAEAQSRLRERGVAEDVIRYACGSE